MVGQAVRLTLNVDLKETVVCDGRGLVAVPTTVHEGSLMNLFRIRLGSPALIPAAPSFAGQRIFNGKR